MKLLMPYHNILSGVLEKKNSASQEYQNLALVAIFVSSSFGVRRVIKRHFFPFISSFYL